MGAGNFHWFEHFLFWGLVHAIFTLQRLLDFFAEDLGSQELREVAGSQELRRPANRKNKLSEKLLATFSTSILEEFGHLGGELAT